MGVKSLPLLHWPDRFRLVGINEEASGWRVYLGIWKPDGTCSDLRGRVDSDPQRAIDWLVQEMTIGFTVTRMLDRLTWALDYEQTRHNEA